jgi:septum formation inhibitor-activating ATPase MinD
MPEDTSVYKEYTTSSNVDLYHAQIMAHVASCIVMSDDDFLNYMIKHVSKNNALFHRKMLERLFLLAKNDIKLDEDITFFTISTEDMVNVINEIKLNENKKSQGEK